MAQHRDLHFLRIRRPAQPDHPENLRPHPARHEQIAFIPAAHPSYIRLAAFDPNQARLAECAAAHEATQAGPPVVGPANKVHRSIELTGQTAG